MTTKLDEICEVISEIEVSEATAEKLHAMMKDYKIKYHRSYQSLMMFAPFRKLWEAIEEMTTNAWAL